MTDIASGVLGRLDTPVRPPPAVGASMRLQRGAGVESASQNASIERDAAAAEDFEGLFGSILVSALKKTLPHRSFFGDAAKGADILDGMVEQLLGTELARQGGFGLKPALMAEFRRRAAADDNATAAPIDGKRRHVTPAAAAAAAYAARRKP